MSNLDPVGSSFEGKLTLRRYKLVFAGSSFTRVGFGFCWIILDSVGLDPVGWIGKCHVGHGLDWIAKNSKVAALLATLNPNLVSDLICDV